MSIANYIKNDLRRRLAVGPPLPEKVTLLSVAELYRVSVTPVRAAVCELIDEGVLCKGNNRRFFPANAGMVRTRDAPDLLPASATLPDLLEIVSSDLVRLSLQGKAVRLHEKPTSEKYGVSRSTLRSVFHRLAGTGLITHIPRRGWVLRPFRQKEMRAFLEVREVFELKALALARYRLRDDDLRRMLDSNRFPETDSSLPKIDNSLHTYIIDKAGNSYIANFFERHGRYYKMLFEWEGRDRETAIDTVRQHHGILEAMLECDWRLARARLRRHIRTHHPILNKIDQHLHTERHADE